MILKIIRGTTRPLIMQTPLKSVLYSKLKLYLSTKYLNMKKTPAKTGTYGTMVEKIMAMAKVHKAYGVWKPIMN